MKTQETDLSFPCTECQAGHMRRTFLTYFTWMDDELITVPDFPAWTCDVCGRREYDLHALSQLNLLLKPDAGKPSPKPRTVRHVPDQKNPRPSQPE